MERQNKGRKLKSEKEGRERDNQTVNLLNRSLKIPKDTRLLMGENV